VSESRAADTKIRILFNGHVYLILPVLTTTVPF